MTADLCGDGIVAFAMPAQDELGLFFEVLEIGHAGLHDEIVGGHCPLAWCRCILHAQIAVCATVSVLSMRTMPHHTLLGRTYAFNRVTGKQEVVASGPVVVRKIWRAHFVYVSFGEFADAVERIL